MSFGVCLERFERGERRPVDGDQLRQALPGATFDAEGDGVLTTTDGGRAQIGFEDGVAWFAVRELTPDLAEAIWCPASAEGLVIAPGMTPARAVLIAPGQEADLPEKSDYFDAPAIRCQSSDELLELLRKGFSQWAKLVDEVYDGLRESFGGTQ